MSSTNLNNYVNVQNLSKSCKLLWITKNDILENISFKTGKNRIYGILGNNGAGKSTAMKILAMSDYASNGKINYYIKNTVNSKLLGFCPQFQGLDDNMTVEEHMKYFLNLYQNDVIENDKLTNQYITNLGLLEFRNCLAKNLSQGNKRKLSTIIASIGNPEFIIMDEPSTGMDPISKRQLWEHIKHISKKSVIIYVTHNYDECEYLSDKILLFESGKILSHDLMKDIDSSNTFILTVNLFRNITNEYDIVEETLKKVLLNSITKVEFTNVIKLNIEINNSEIIAYMLY